ncbi:MAG: CtsR family transcriptional regulator [Oscillospiraceae bacterium]
MNVTDVIVCAINELLSNCDGEALINRNEFANKIGCAPSQINYVIGSRYKQELGYLVQSKRGGGGYIKIIKRQFKENDLLIHIINVVGDSLDESFSKALVNSLLSENVISISQAKIMLGATSSQNFKGLSLALECELRSAIFKSMLANCF